MHDATTFVLDPAIAADTVPVLSLGLSELRLTNDRRFPWLLLVPRRAGAVEIIDLAKADRAALLEEIAAASGALRLATNCDKLNIGALGNKVRQLHVHVVARFTDDAAWPGPVWGAGEAVAYDVRARDRLVATIRAALASPAPAASF
jgi:diadenosine tetraphosphate (Ap4A) HIT family hydrolase